MPLISAHRCGAGDEQELENTKIALDRALASDVDYIEFDVQRCAGDVFVLYHDSYIMIDGKRVALSVLTFEEFAAAAEHYLRFDEVLLALKGRKKAHIDLKFLSDSSTYAEPTSTHEVAATKEAVAVLGVDNLIITTLEDQSIAAVRSWSRTECPSLLVGLSLGRDSTGYGTLATLRLRLRELFPGRRFRKCDANLVVANKQLAKLRLARWARSQGFPLLVWTVDEESELRSWLHDDRTWMVTTNYPARALQVR